MTKALVWLITDTHCGNRHGALAPGTVLLTEDEDGNATPYEPVLESTQEIIYTLFTRAYDIALREKKRRPVYLIHHGDITHGLKHPADLLTNSRYEQQEIAIQFLRPALDIAEATRFNYGTAAHAGAHGSMERNVVARFAAEGYDVAIAQHWLLNIAGAQFDTAHKGPGQSKRNWLRGNLQRYYHRDIVAAAHDRFESVPTVVSRGHFHSYWPAKPEYYEDNGVKFGTMLLLPPLCGMTYYAHGATRARANTTMGSVLVWVDAGRVVDVQAIVQYFDHRRKETL